MSTGSGINRYDAVFGHRELERASHYAREWIPVFDPYPEVLLEDSSSSDLEKVEIDRERNIARYQLVKNDSRDEHVFWTEIYIFESEPGLETALLHDTFESTDTKWLYHDGQTYYRTRDGFDTYFVPANKPEITNHWDTVREVLSGELA